MVQQDDVMKYISGAGLTEVQARSKFRSMLELNREEDTLGCFMVYNEAGIFIGDGKLVSYKHDTSLLEIGYILKSTFWNRGYGTMICHKIITLADELLPGKDMVGLIDPDNIASKKLLEKFGFRSYFLGMEDDLPTEKLLLKRTWPAE
ncbi:MAG: GNAT family N-acetyltransferase [Bacteroidetes bacterium 43-16]|nr:MAG: GNAT family N-acetyltransferase [Bacteroidetes bacterium 43-16]